jgi:hypothetical protein
LKLARLSRLVTHRLPTSIAVSPNAASFALIRG